MSIELTVEQSAMVENQVRQDLKAIDLGSKLEKLLENDLFREIIMDYFLKDEVARLMTASVDNNLSKEDRDFCITCAQASAYMKQWIAKVLKAKQNAEDDLTVLREGGYYNG